MDLTDQTTQRNLAVVALIATIIIAATVVFIVTIRIHSAGRIKAVGCEVFADPGTTIVLTEIDWGLMSPGDLSGVMSYIKNTRNTPFNLTLTTENWSPTNAANYLTLEWNYTGQVLQPGDVLAVQITLFVDPLIQDVDVFSFYIVVTATEVAQP